MEFNSGFKGLLVPSYTVNYTATVTDKLQKRRYEYGSEFIIFDLQRLV